MTGKNIIEIVDKIIESQGRTADRLIPVLQSIQQEFNYLPETALRRICEKTDSIPSSVYGIATFYSQFRLNPVGEHIVKVCLGTACHVKGSVEVYDAFRRSLHLKDNEDTDTKGIFTLEQVACLGCCTLAPVVQIDNITYGHVTAGKTGNILEDYLAHKNNHGLIVAPHGLRGIDHVQGEIRIGLGSCCVASGSAAVKSEMESSLKRNRVNVNVKHVGCVGVCNQVPILEIQKPGEQPSFYAKIRPEEVNDVIRRHFKPYNPIDKLKSGIYNLFDQIVTDGIPKTVRYYSAENADTPLAEFLNGQLCIATEHRGALNPNDLNEYKSKEGFTALYKSLLKMSPAEIIEIITTSGLRGRGGAGFPSGVKWKLVLDAPSDKKYLICNGDEGDPGAFMDRMLLESYPFRILEGMIIAGYAIGASEGIFYIRAEYQLAVKRIREAIKLCEDEGLLGDNILKSKFSFHVNVFEGAGAFVCGEETALIASVEGKRGLPTLRPPYPAVRGLWGYPTLINNVETFSMISWIIRHGAEAFNTIGSTNSKGTKVFALAGKINRGGLIEVPMGISLRKIVEEIGGGIPDDRKFKAIQIGGPSGGCIPASMADLAVDYNSLTEAGAMMGSGGLIVLDETDCMVDIAHYFLSFTQNQSCGRCSFCRIGTRRMLEILEKIICGKATHDDLSMLEDLAHKTKKGSICGLGKSAPNPVLTTLKYFREEYIAHINGQCPTGKCKNLITYSITQDCIGCTKCAQQCPSDAIALNPYELHAIDNAKCIKCDICRHVCPVNAVITR